MAGTTCPPSPRKSLRLTNRRQVVSIDVRRIGTNHSQASWYRTIATDPRNVVVGAQCRTNRQKRAAKRRIGLSTVRNSNHTTRTSHATHQFARRVVRNTQSSIVRRPRTAIRIEGCDIRLEASDHSQPFRRLSADQIILVRRNRQRRQNTNDRHNDHQFDQGETLLYCTNGTFHFNVLPRNRDLMFQRLALHGRQYAAAVPPRPSTAKALVRH